MITIVLAANVFIALLCLVTAWQLLQARVLIRGIADTLLQIERDTHAILGEAPNVIIIGQVSVGGLRQNLKKNQGKPSPLSRVKLVLTLLIQAQRIWQLRLRPTPIPTGKARRNPRGR